MDNLERVLLKSLNGTASTAPAQLMDQAHASARLLAQTEALAHLAYEVPATLLAVWPTLARMMSTGLPTTRSTYASGFLSVVQPVPVTAPWSVAQATPVPVPRSPPENVIVQFFGT